MRYPNLYEIPYAFIRGAYHLRCPTCQLTMIVRQWPYQHDVEGCQSIWVLVKQS